MVLGKLPVLGRPTNLDYSRARAYCAYSRCGWGGLDIFTLIYHFYLLSPSLKGPLSPKQPTNQPIPLFGRLKYCLKGPFNPKTTNQSIAFAVGAGGGLFGHFYSHLSFLSSVSLSQKDGPKSGVVRWCWVNLQYRGVLQFGLQ